MSYTLPLDPVTTLVEPMALTEPAPPPSRKGTLLIVDDEDSVRESLRVIFKDDYQILMAGDGATAIEIARTTKVDVAILDIKMTSMSGIEVLERLKWVDPSIEAVM
jgi:response regulator RpfG family c-di-GMP phosphodiesterase